MAFTYDLAAPLGEVRLLIPDNDADNFELQDAEINKHLSRMGNNVDAAAAESCDMLARLYAKRAGFTADGLTVRHGERARQYAARAAELRARLGGSISSVTLDKTDGFADEATDSEYGSRTVYVRV